MNEPFSGWTKTFTDSTLCAAIVDRLTFNGQIIETGTTSDRLTQARDARKSSTARLNSVTSPRLHIVRTFNWGLLLLSDRGTKDLPPDVGRDR